MNEEFKIVEINVIYLGSVIGEIRIQYGTVPPQYDAGKFLNKLAKAEHINEFRLQILLRVSALVQQ